MTMKKEKYTRANPNSLCMTVNIAGNKTIQAAISWDLTLVKSVSAWERYFAKASETHILQNSAG
jgi:hypothetical protein